MAIRMIPGVLAVLIGGVWFLQGISVIHGSPMTGTTTWTVIGAIVVVAGLALVATGLRKRRS